MSLCDECIAPGSCCKRMWLTSEGEPLTYWTDEPIEWEDMAGRPMPFVPIPETVETFIDDETGREWAQAWWTCPKLDDATGRCTIYEDRPDTCRKYQPLDNKLCAMFRNIPGVK